MTSLLIKQKSDVRLNESMEQGAGGALTFKGPFTICSTPERKIINRNDRIYMEKEVLRHLGYLRDKIKADGSILGELDHPEGRFDTNLKCVSHKVVDLWYDINEHVVMGKLVLLDTPNGKIAESVVKAGYPLYVSSRAAGGVDERTKEVTIDQIFTYDIVCTPGFAEAKLEQVSECADPKVAGYLNESAGALSAMNSVNKAKSYGLNESVTFVQEMPEAPALSERDKGLIEAAAGYSIDELSKPLYESDSDKENGVTPQMKQPKQIEGNSALPTMSLDPNDPSNKPSAGDSKNGSAVDEGGDASSDATDEDKKEKRDLILDIEGEDGEPGDDEKKEKRALILDIQKIEATPETHSEDGDAGDGDAENGDDAGDNVEEDGKSDAEKEQEEKDEKELEKVKKEEADKAEDLKSDTEDTLASIDELIKSVEDNKKDEEKKDAVKEAIMTAYPFTVSLSPDNFSRFARLDPADKRRCNDFIVENAIFDVKQINEMWSIVLDNSSRMEQNNWLKLAEKDDIELYMQAPKSVQDAIEETAKYCILETKADVDEFWERQGLRRERARRLMNEEWSGKYNADTLFDNRRDRCPYTDAYVDMISELMDEF